MTADERIFKLEAQIVLLTARDERRESEHRHLLESYEAVTAGREKLHSETAETMKLFSAYWDERIGAMAKRRAVDGEESDWAALFADFVDDFFKYQRQEVTVFCALRDRVRELEDGRLRDLQRFGKLLGIHDGPQAR